MVPFKKYRKWFQLLWFLVFLEFSFKTREIFLVNNLLNFLLTFALSIDLGERGMGDLSFSPHKPLELPPTRKIPRNRGIKISKNRIIRQRRAGFAPKPQQKLVFGLFLSCLPECQNPLIRNFYGSLFRFEEIYLIIQIFYYFLQNSDQNVKVLKFSRILKF